MDIALENEQALREYYEHNIAANVGKTQDALAVYYIGGDIKWSSTPRATSPTA